MKPRFEDIPPIVLAAGERKEIRRTGSYLLVAECSTTTPPQIEFPGEVPFSAKLGYEFEFPEGEKFNHFHIINPTATTMTVVLYVTLGRVHNASFTATGEIPVRDVTNSISTPLAMAIGTSSAVPLNAVTGQREVHIQNTGAYSVWYGDSSVNPGSRGIEIPAGATYIINTSATIYFKASGGASSISLNVFKTV